MTDVTLGPSSGPLLQSYTYNYGIDASGNHTAGYHAGDVVSVTELDGSVVTYSYDDLNRLLTATRTGTNPFTQSYVYDANDNRTSITDGGTTIAQTYDAANQMQSYNGIQYHYDRDGNLTSYFTNSLTYDASNKWTSGMVNGTSVSYQYDGLGRRVSTTVSGQRTDLWYDRTGLALESGANAATYLRDSGGLLLSGFAGGAVNDYGHDKLVDVTALVSTTGTLVGAYRFDPWGQSLGGTPIQYNPSQFVQSYSDGATGFDQMGARYYQASAGRFTQLDPLPAKIFSNNRYAYSSCNPTNSIDPSGLDGCWGEAAWLGASAVELVGVLQDQNWWGFLSAVSSLVAAAGALATCISMLHDVPTDEIDPFYWDEEYGDIEAGSSEAWVIEFFGDGGGWGEFDP
jgi:RHS repeat-associated protein